MINLIIKESNSIFHNYAAKISEIGKNKCGMDIVCNSELYSVELDYLLLNEKIIISNNNTLLPSMLHYSEEAFYIIFFTDKDVDRADVINEMKLIGIEGCHVGLYEFFRKQGLISNINDLMNLKLIYYVVYKEKEFDDPFSNWAMNIKKMKHDLKGNCKEAIKLFEGNLFDYVDVIGEKTFNSMLNDNHLKCMFSGTSI